MSSVSGADIRGVLYALTDVIVSALDDGNIVRLGELGSLRLSLKSNGMPTAGQVQPACIKEASVVFTPGPRIKKMLRGAKYQKIT